MCTPSSLPGLVVLSLPCAPFAAQREIDRWVPVDAGPPDMFGRALAGHGDVAIVGAFEQPAIGSLGRFAPGEAQVFQG